MTSNKAMLWGMTLLAVGFLFFPKYVGFLVASRQAESEPTNADLVRKTTVAIEGMNCEASSLAIEKAVRGVPGVLSVQMDYLNKQAVVSTEVCCAFPKGEILKAIEEAGYSGSVACEK